MFVYLVIMALVVIFDQISKIFVLNNFSNSKVVTFIPKIVDIVFVKNTGAAFSIFSDSTLILGIVSVIFSVVGVCYLLKTRSKDKLYLSALSLMIGGAAGNGIDRIFRHYVIDFIELRFIHFPVFNIADIAVTVGACLLILDIFLTDRRKNGTNSN